MRVLFFILLFAQLSATELSRIEKLSHEEKLAMVRCMRYAAQFYSLGEEEIREITQDILISSDTKEETKQKVLLTGRRFFLFCYPSDGLQVKGTLSFLPDSFGKPLLFYLRGGNRIFGLAHPANDFGSFKDYTVLSTAYRGGVSEGEDEFGGAEVNDVENLLAYLPTLERKMNLSLEPSRVFLVWASRGGIEMFIAQTKSPYLKRQVFKDL
jgi:hypothetical protein